MTRLLLASALVGVLAAALLAYHLSESVAYAAEPVQRDTDQELLRAVVAGCAEASGAATVRIQGGVFEVRCTPNLGVGPAVRRGR